MKTIYICENCGNESLKWAGRCFACGEWNTLKELRIKNSELRIKNKEKVEPERLKDIKIGKYQRISTGILEFDRVLGGGIVLGSLVLLGGEPGIGKSTILLQVADKISQNPKLKSQILYVSGEESKEQLKFRAERLNIKGENILLLPETDIDVIIQSVLSLSHSFTPLLLIVDSIQTMYDENYPATPGSIVQVRECALRLQQLAKTSKIPVIITGHVTKEGSVAGPKTLEHLVDVVLYLEGERFQNTRILRGTKNRFGATEEIGIFEMKDAGLSEVKDPSKIFLEERREEPGSCLSSILSGTRAFLVEIQTLLTKSPFGYPKRTVSGFDIRRLDLLLAVLEKRMGLPLLNYDVYVNIVGGMKIEDRGADLAICGSIFSAFKNRNIKPKTVLIGEVGLSGELRNVNQMQKRIKEAKSLGFVNIIGPEVRTLEEALKRAIEH
jgi:DNA repair protein RadA/Sms